MSGRVKLGIIGCGIAANDLHWPALKNLSDCFEIVEVCNRSPAKALSFAKLIGSSTGKEPACSTDYQNILANPEIAAVNIALPVELNAPVIRDSLRAGKHVICEKPLAENLNSAAALLDLEKNFPHQVAMVAENVRYRRFIGRIKELIANGSIGRPYLVQWRHLTKIEDDNKYAQTSWRKNHVYQGGFITDAGVHDVAALHDLLGPLELLSSFSDCVNPAIGSTDCMMCHFVSQSGLHGSLSLGFSVVAHEQNQLIILGSAGTLTFEHNLLTLKKADDSIHEEDLSDDWGFEAEFRDFYQAITQGKKPHSTFAKAYADLAFILACTVN